VSRDGRGSPLSVEEATAIVRLGAAAGSGEADRLVSALERADHVHPDDIEELLLQTYLFAGFPRTINAFFTWQAWASRGDHQRGDKRVERRDADDLRRRGEDLCRRVYGDHYDALQIRLKRLHPEIAEWTLVEGYGKVLGRPGPPGPDRRELAAVGTLIALDAGRQLASHLRGAVLVGVPRDILSRAASAVAEEWGVGASVEEMLAALDPREREGAT
jgi:4-carboxymuconolactone decarboxylase